jgi:hypothetical protein
MKAIVIVSLGGLLLAGCATNDVQVSRVSEAGVDRYHDQPQTAVAGEGSLMPGAYDNRAMDTGQFTGRERTSDQIGQRPTLPPEADTRELERSDEKGTAIGAGSLGQSGIVPGREVTAETLLEEPE